MPIFSLKLPPPFSVVLPGAEALVLFYGGGGIAPIQVIGFSEKFKILRILQKTQLQQ